MNKAMENSNTLAGGLFVQFMEPQRDGQKEDIQLITYAEFCVNALRFLPYIYRLSVSSGT